MSYKQMTGNIISATKVEPVGTSEVGAASGVWNLDDQYDYKRGANWPEAGVPDPDSLIESNFSIDVYLGAGSDRLEIVNGMDLANKGGLVWAKTRGDDFEHIWLDTVRGKDKYIYSSTTAAEATAASGDIDSFNADGFSLEGNTTGAINRGNTKTVAWTFKQAPKFFDIVTYEGNGSAGRNINHDLGSVPGMIMIKNLEDTENWMVYHRGMNAGTNPEQYVLNLNLNAAQQDDDQFHDTAPTNAVFTLGSNAEVNANNKSYVAYIFAHETGSASMIQCGTYEGNGNATGPVINLGWEPQWLLIKNADANNNWELVDNMRDFRTPKVNVGLFALNPNNNTVEAEGRAYGATATGFSIVDDNADVNANNKTYIYMAIRRPNMATITDATEVFAISTNGQAGDSKAPAYRSTFPVDMYFEKSTGGSPGYISNRLTGKNYMRTNATNAVAADNNLLWSFNNGVYNTTGSNNAYYGWMWKRAKGYFDVVAYTGTGSAKTEAHSLGVAPEMMWVKARNTTEDWTVWAGFGNDKYLNLNDNAVVNSDSVTTIWNNTAPTSAVFSVGTHDRTNASGDTYIAYLFATLAGVSKVGSVTHSGSSTDVNCGFSAGARVVMLKRTDDAGSWFWWDSTRGIIAGNDPYFLLDTNAAQVTNTDYIDPLASGFQISGSFQDGDYIFLAIA